MCMPKIKWELLMSQKILETNAYNISSKIVYVYRSQDYPIVVFSTPLSWNNMLNFNVNDK